jgi:DNA invertase Pin-like site-specific DNA recombinase
MTKAAVWIRVSTSHQDSANQVPDVERFCAHHGYEIVRRFEVAESAWNGGKTGGGYQATLAEAMQGAHAGEYEVLVVWALDRITREGAEGALRLIRQLRERHCTLLSVKEDWLNGSPQIADVLVAFAGWMGQQESARRSERIRAGLARRKAAGLPVGRQTGAKDKGQRKRSGYVARYEREREQAAKSPGRSQPV